MWIIPARAGFTCPRARQPCSWQDHPRSRGVYQMIPWRRSSVRGSSPLARGLHSLPACDPRQNRIIPARAGFTGESSGSSCHFTGSSPLARGLHAKATYEEVKSRIIPARAGFTTSLAELAALNSDHPRSRGVYYTVSGRTLIVAGSSPLARGLHQNGSRRRGRLGIIPARAGFTHGKGGVVSS